MNFISIPASIPNKISKKSLPFIYKFFNSTELLLYFKFVFENVAKTTESMF